MLNSEQVEDEEPNEVIRHNRMVFRGWCAGEGTKEKQRKATIADTDERGLHWTEGMQSADVNSGLPRVASFVSRARAMGPSRRKYIYGELGILVVRTLY